MKRIIKLSAAALLLMMMSACGNKGKDVLAIKKAELEKIKTQREELDNKISKLQAEINKLDTAAAASKTTLVSLSVINNSSFRHYIDLRGNIDAEDISYISPRMGPAQVKAVYVKQGQEVRKGQLLLKLEDAIIRQQIVAARQQLQGIKTQLTYARTLYDRQKNLWDQGIGTEVQLLTSKTNVESLENQLTASGEQIKVAEEQMRTTFVNSDVDGIADIVNIRVGEIFSGMGTTGPQIKIVNIHNPKVVVNIPENYVSRLHKGSIVEVSVPDMGKQFISEISLISQSIETTQRGFIAEIKLPGNAGLKPNQNAVVRILDYSVDSALVIPVNVVQSDETGKYVFVAQTSGNKMQAKRQAVVLGEIYRDSVEIKSGLAAGWQLVTSGYQNIYEGQILTSQH